MTKNSLSSGKTGGSRRRVLPLLVGASALAVSALAVTATGALGSTATDANGFVIVSDATTSQSSVAGSSPTSLGDSPLAKTAAGRAARANASSATDDPTAYTTSSALVVYYDPKTKAVLYRHRYGQKSEGKMIRPPARVLSGHGTGGTSSASGCVKVTISESGHSTLGSQIWIFRNWTDWCWTRSNEVVSMNSNSWSQDTDGPWGWDKIENHDQHYYDFSTDNGYPRSAFWNMRQGGFYGPCISTSLTCHEYPTVTLAAYYNGTNQWWTS